MKKIITTISRLGILALIAGFTFQATPVSAAYAFNGRSEDCNTTSVINDTTGEGYSRPCWSGKNISVKAGDEFTVKVYARNTGDTAAQNVTLGMSNIHNDVVTGGNSYYYSGQIVVGNTAVARQNVSVKFNGTGSMKIEFVAGELEKTSNGQSQGIQSISANSAAFTDSGTGGLLVYSSMPAHLGTWVTVKAKYRVVATDVVNPPVNDELSVTTDYHSIISHDTNNGNGSARLHGSYSTNISSSSVRTYFNYRGQENGSTSVQTKTGLTGNFNDTISGLSAGDYDYQACAQVGSKTNCGSWKSFVINNNNDNNNNNRDLRVNTLAPTINSERNGNVTLRGEYSRNNNGTARTYFEFTNGNRNAGSYSSTAREFDSYVTGLSTGTYEYRACVENNTERVCGNWRSFRINRDDYQPPVQDTNRPVVTTLSAIQRTGNSITVDGWFNIQSCGGSTWFEYGTNQSMIYNTVKINRNAYNNGSMAQVIPGLAPNTTYYYRAVAENCNGTTYGSMLSTTTTGSTVVVNPPKGGTTTTVNTVKVVKNIGAGSRYVRLMIDNSQDSVMKGDSLMYDVYWENITSHTLHNLVLEVSLPEGLQIVSTDQGQLDRAANKVYVNIKKLEGGEKDDMTIRADVVGARTLLDGDSVTARAILAFENPTVEQAYENAIAYDSDTYFVKQMASGIGFFGGTFLPATLAGWLFLILLLIIILAIIRYAIRREEKHIHYHGAVVKTDHENQSSETIQDDYIPYRPTPKE